MRPLVLIIALTLLLPSAAWAAPGSVRSSVADRVAGTGRAAVIVELDESIVPEGWLQDAELVRGQRRRVVAAQIETIYGLGGTDAGTARPYPILPFMTLEVGPESLVALEALPGVRSVRLVEAQRPHLNTSVAISQSPETAAIGFDGTGQTVVVLDTGTELGHQNFPIGKAVAEACFATGTNGAGNPQGGGGDCPGGGDTAFGAGAAVPCDYHDQCFHGTHVAGIAVGSGPDRDGVATGASLIPIQVFSEFPASTPACGGVPCPLSWDSDTDAALLYVYNTLRLSHDIAAVNMSLGSGAFNAACDASRPSTKAAIDLLRSVGIATVISTGNNSCGGTGCNDAISAPACISSAVSVSATRDGTSVPAYANRAAFMSLFAIGHTVSAPDYEDLIGYRTASGTSMAAPHVAGAWAQIKHALPAASVSTILTALQDTGETIQFGIPRIRIRDALGELGFPECDDGIDNDGDGEIDGGDIGCVDAADLFETDATLPCDDGIDNDSDGDIDTADAGCFSPGWSTEAPACNDGVDNDSDGGIDFDGTPPDPQCTAPHQDRETVAKGCGLGPELLFLLPILRLARRRF